MSAEKVNITVETGFHDPTKLGLGRTSLVVVGQGYVGLPLAMRAVDVGFTVVGIDTDLQRVEALNSGISFVDDVSHEAISNALECQRYRASSCYADAAGFDVAVISVPTPLRDGEPDLGAVIASASSIAPHVTRGSLVILESTTYPGTTEEIVVPLLEAGSGLVGGRDFFVGYSPERIDPGNSVWPFERTPKLVAGIDEASTEEVAAFFDRLIERTIRVRGTREAEFAKIIENTFRAVNIALVNELSILANCTGLDIWEAIGAASTKPFGFMKFVPGPGVGGHCLPIDPVYLDWFARERTGRPLSMVQAAAVLNREMPSQVVERALNLLRREGIVPDQATVYVLGLTYKAGSGDTRESPALEVANLLLARGVAVIASDPYVSPQTLPHLNLVDFSPQNLRQSDLVILLTEHPQFDAEVVALNAKRIFDTRNYFPAGVGEKL